MNVRCPYINPIDLAYYVCAKTDWTIGSHRLNYILYIIALCYAGKKKEMIVPNLFEINYPLLSPVNPVVYRRIGYQKIVRHYNISLWPFSIKIPSENDYYIDEEKRYLIDRVINFTLPLTNSHLFSTTINGRYRDGCFIKAGELSLRDMIIQYQNILEKTEIK